MAPSQNPPFVFLSHSGADAEKARELKRLLLAGPDARTKGLRVWFDKDDLRPGTPWSAQIAEAIRQATAFVIYVGSGGVMNWVEAEVDLALSRATTDKQSPLLFIPVLADKSAGSSALPPFAKRYQGVRNPLGQSKELEKLLKAVLDADWGQPVKLIDEPFVGLRSMREEEADRFFGRAKEIADLGEKFRRHRVVAIVADSGTGKSSLAEAGFAPAFRGGALADLARSEPDDRVWHVVTMRPGRNPEEGLRSGVIASAEKLDRTPDECEGLRERTVVADPSKTAYALKCNLRPAEKTATLLIVDQFEELFTATPNPLVAPFVRLMLDLADRDKDFRILITVRSDYFNLLSDIKDAAGEAIRGVDGKTLFERLNAERGEAILRLKRVSEEGLSDIVMKPLRLAGVSGDQTALVKAIERDISDQPSDLPLLQVALKAAWRQHTAANLDLLGAYHSVGGVLGALAREAETVRTATLSAEDQARLESIFVRLVRLGDITGATRRTAALSEFDAPRQALVRRLGDDTHGRLIVVSEASAEIAHEALITQWPWLLRTLRKDNDHVRDVGTLDRLMTKSREWSEAELDRREEFLAAGAERDVFSKLAEARPDWLSGTDGEFVAESNRSFEDERKREQSAREKEQRAFRIARHNELVALTALANIDADKRPVNAAKLALAAWPRDGDDTMTPKLPETLDALGRIVPNLRERRLFKDAGYFAAFSPDGKHVLTADRTAQLRDASSGAVLVTFKGHEQRILSAAFSPDGKQVLTSSYDHTARLWDAASGAALVTFEGHDKTVDSAAFSPDGKQVLTASWDKTARLWDAASGAVLVTFNGHGGSVASAAFTPDGKRALTASEDIARLWDAASGVALVTFKGHEQLILSATFSADGKQVLTASRDTTARLWDAASGAALVTFKGHDGPVASAAFSPDGKQVLTASDDETARLWDTASGAALVTFKGHDEPVVSAAFSPDGKQVLTASADKTARSWDAASGAALVIFKGHEHRIVSTAFSPGGKQILTASYDNTARLWDAALGAALVTFKGHRGSIFSAAFNADGRQILTASSDNTARLWDAASGAALVTFEGHGKTVVSAAFSPDGKQVLTASSDETARLWDAASGAILVTFRGHGDRIVSAAFSLDGKQVLTASWDKTARLWDAASGAALITFKGHGDRIVSAAFSQDGKQVLTASDDKTSRLWDAASGAALVTFKGHGHRILSAAFSPDGKQVLTASWDYTAQLWDAASGAALVTFEDRGEFIVSAAFSPDGKQVLTVSENNTARLWDAASGAALVTYRGHGGPGVSVAFRPCGKQVLFASSDNTPRLWDAASGAALVAFKGHEQRVVSAAFSPDGMQVLTASHDSTARLWDVSTIPKGNILQVACALLRLREDPVTLDGVTDYPLTFDRPICATDPPPPDPLGEAETPAR